MDNTDVMVIYLSDAGYRVSNYFGKIMKDMTYATLAEAETACKEANYNYVVA